MAINPFMVAAYSSEVSCLGMMLLFVLTCVIVYLLLQRAGEFMVGRRKMSLGELLWYTLLVAVLLSIVAYMNQLRRQ